MRLGIMLPMQITKTIKSSTKCTEHVPSTQQNKKLFLEYVDAWGIVDGESVVDSFITGFKLGARFAYDTFVSAESDVLKEG